MARSGEPLREITLQELTKKVFDLELSVEKHNHVNTGSQGMAADAIKDGTVSGNLQSQNFITGASGTGWKLFASGKLEASEGNFRGDITGSTGTFTGSITIGTGNNVVKADATDGLWVGNATFASAPFSVTLAGALKSTSGTIANWSIGTSVLSSTNIQMVSGAANTARFEVGSGANVAGINSANVSGDITFWSGSSFANRATANFRVTAAGALVAASATITGTVTATTLTATGSGNIGGFTIASTTLTATNLTLQSGAANTAHIAVGTGANIAGLNSANIAGDIAIWAGDTHANRASAEFRVTAAGALTATSATITGTVTATSLTATGSGSIAGWTIGSTTLVGGGITLDSSGIITGGTIRTSSSGQRVELDGANNRINFRDSAGALGGIILGQSGNIFIARGGGSGSITIEMPLLMEDEIVPDVFGAGLIPKTDDTYDLGASTLQWKDLWIDGTANLDNTDIDGTLNVQGVSTFQNTIQPSAAGKDIGASGSANRWAVGYINKISGLGTANVIDFGISGRIATNQDFTFANITSEGSPPAGTMHWNSSTVTMRIFDGSAWKSVDVT